MAGLCCRSIDGLASMFSRWIHWQSGNFGWISTPCRPPSRNTIAKFRDVAVEFCVSDDLAPITHRVGPFVKTTTFVRTDSFDFPKKKKRNKKRYVRLTNGRADARNKESGACCPSGVRLLKITAGTVRSGVSCSPHSYSRMILSSPASMGKGAV